MVNLNQLGRRSLSPRGLGGSGVAADFDHKQAPKETTMENPTKVPLAKACEIHGIADLNKGRIAFKKSSALFLVHGLEFVDLDKFQRGLEAEIDRKSTQSDNRATTKGEKGRSIGLLRARISRGPKLIEAKEKAVAIAKTVLSKAGNNWDKYQAKRKLTELEEQLKRLTDNLVNDQAELDKFLSELPED